MVCQQYAEQYMELGGHSTTRVLAMDQVTSPHTMHATSSHCSRSKREQVWRSMPARHFPAVSLAPNRHWLSLPLQGHLMLLGPPGSGRRTLAKLAAHMTGCLLLEANLKDQQKGFAWRDMVKTGLMAAGVQGRWACADGSACAWQRQAPAAGS